MEPNVAHVRYKWVSGLYDVVGDTYAMIFFVCNLNMTLNEEAALIWSWELVTLLEAALNCIASLLFSELGSLMLFQYIIVNSRRYVCVHFVEVPLYIIVIQFIECFKVLHEICYRYHYSAMTSQLCSNSKDVLFITYSMF